MPTAHDTALAVAKPTFLLATVADAPDDEVAAQARNQLCGLARASVRRRRAASALRRASS
jgi:hypothetical protein